ncbi:MAG: hypothetical protein U1F58_09720 [Burkholderiales bacterium]
MNDLIGDSSELLAGAGYRVERSPGPKGSEVLIFEDNVYLGFVLAYATADDLIRNWPDDSRAVIARYSLALRRSGDKAWNVYLVLLAASPHSDQTQTLLAEIEEDLVGMRKIVRAGVSSVTELKAAFLPLLRLQSPPKLEAVDMPAEIRLRASEVESKGIDAFLSLADESVVLQLLEDLQ